MPGILSQPSPQLGSVLSKTFKKVCPPEKENLLMKAVEGIFLQPSFHLPPNPAFDCRENPLKGTSVLEALLSDAVDEPDFGMDQNLPDSAGNPYDPTQDRKWMGGTRGPSSQGFRHMYFGGWKAEYPLTTFQIPIHAVGKAPDRTQILAGRAKELIRNGHLAEGVRILAWALHYIQDLSQPFHSVQLVNLRMVNWSQLFTWPPQHAFSNLVSGTTRTMGNYHLAFEDFIMNILQQPKMRTFLTHCLAEPTRFVKIQFDPRSQTPYELAIATSENSIHIARRLGSNILALFGDALMKPGVDLKVNAHWTDYNSFLKEPQYTVNEQTLEQTACEALANGSLGSQMLIEWAFNGL